MTRLGAVLLALLLVGPVAAQQSVQVPATIRVQPAQFFLRVTGGSLLFPDTVLTGRDQVVRASNAPIFEIINARGDNQSGWRLTLVASDLSSSTGYVLSASALQFSGSGGAVTVLAGTPVDPVQGPAETEATGSLGSGVTVLSTQPGFGMGTYLYQPLPGSFQLSLPASIPAGEYRGTMVANLLVGP